ncbi:MAG: alpha/beta hydrolase [Pricia sp.]
MTTIIKRASALLLLIFALSASAQNGPFEVTVEGNGQPILFFPGFASTGEVWDATVAKLSQNYECHIFTFAGFGGVAPVEKPWLPKIKKGIEDYVREQKLENPMIIGHSLGGSLALWLASEENHPYSKLILVDALASTGALMIPDFKSENMVYDNPYSQQMLAMNDEEFQKTVTQMASGMTLNEEKRADIIRDMLQADRETFVHGYTDLLKLDLREDVARIEIPVTILAATHPYGKEMVEKTITEQFKNLEDYKVEYAENSAHFIMYDRPEWLLEAIKTHL